MGEEKPYKAREGDTYLSDQGAQENLQEGAGNPNIIGRRYENAAFATVLEQHAVSVDREQLDALIESDDQFRSYVAAGAVQIYGILTNGEGDYVFYGEDYIKDNHAGIIPLETPEIHTLDFPSRMKKEAYAQYDLTDKGLFLIDANNLMQFGMAKATIMDKKYPSPIRNARERQKRFDTHYNPELTKYMDGLRNRLKT